MTQHKHARPHHPPADDIRRQEFSHRMRGLDEYEVREFLDLLANRMNAVEKERADFRAENERLRAEVEELRNKTEDSDQDEISPQAVHLFSQAQQVADQLVEEAVRHARDLMSSARNQEREILDRAHEAAENAVRMSGAAVSPNGTVEGYTTPVPEVEYVRTFAQVAQIQLRSVVEALAEQVEKLGEVPRLSAGQSTATDEVWVPRQPGTGWDSRGSVEYPGPQATEA